MLSRREMLGFGVGAAAAALARPASALAADTRPDWMLALSDMEGDVARRALRPIQGRAPADLRGTLYRNGPARFRRGPTRVGHWFDGDGMIRAWRIRNGAAEVEARFVDTPKRRVDDRLGRVAQPGFATPPGKGMELSSADSINAANTNVLPVGGRLLALWEAGSAFAIDPATLRTEGPVTLRADLAHMPFLAHPRVEPSGRIWNLGQSGRRAFIWRLGADGRLEHAQAVELPAASYIHDFTATARHIVILCQPWLYEEQTLPVLDGLRWRPEQGTRVLVLDKDDFSRRRLFELPPLFFFHVNDGWEERDGTIRFDGCFEPDPSFAAEGAKRLLDGVYARAEVPQLTSVVLRPDGSASMERLGLSANFPRREPSIAGKAAAETIYVGGYRSDRPFPRSVGAWNWARERTDEFDFGTRRLVEEFVPSGRWLIGTTLNLDTGVSELHLFNRRSIVDGPVASWRADMALPLTFHGGFVAA